jgi:RNA polymerase sigma-70 factor, ECF subfamily
MTPAKAQPCSNSAAVMKADLIKVLPNLRAFAISLCGDYTEADDLVQDTLMKAWEHQDKFEPGTNLRAWLFTILRNTYFSRFRKRRREVEDPDGALAATLSSAPTQGFHVELAELRQALALLVPDQREALMHIAAMGLSYEEAAAIMGCPVGTIKSRVNRARTRLCELLFLEPAAADERSTRTRAA